MEGNISSSSRSELHNILLEQRDQSRQHTNRKQTKRGKTELHIKLKILQNISRVYLRRKLDNFVHLFSTSRNFFVNMGSFDEAGCRVAEREDALASRESIPVVNRCLRRSGICCLSNILSVILLLATMINSPATAVPISREVRSTQRPISEIVEDIELAILDAAAFLYDCHVEPGQKVECLLHLFGIRRFKDANARPANVDIDNLPSPLSTEELQLPLHESAPKIHQHLKLYEMAFALMERDEVDHIDDEEHSLFFSLKFAEVRRFLRRATEYTAEYMQEKNLTQLAAGPAPDFDVTTNVNAYSNRSLYVLRIFQDVINKFQQIVRRSA